MEDQNIEQNQNTEQSGNNQSNAEANKADAGTKTILGGDIPEGKASPLYPDDWREKYAKDDAKKLETLKRYASPDAALDALFEARKKISSGFKNELPKDATPEQIAEYRKELGIPEKPEDYKLQLKDGIVIGEEDKQILNKVLGSLHSKNVSNEVASEMVNAFYEARQLETEAEIQKLTQEKEQATKELRETWGNDFTRNVNLVTGFLQKRLGEDGFNNLLTAKLADGTILGNNVGMLNKLYELAAEVDPDVQIINSLNNRGSLDSISERIREIEGIIKKEESRYYSDSQLQEEYGKLLSARETLTKK